MVSERFFQGCPCLGLIPKTIPGPTDLAPGPGTIGPYVAGALESLQGGTMITLVVEKFALRLQSH